MSGILEEGPPVAYADVMDKVDPVLSVQRDAFFRYAVKKRAEFAAPLDELVENIRGLMEKVVVPEEGGIPRRDQARILKEVLSGEKAMMNAFENVVADGMRQAMRKSLLAQNGFLAQWGLQKLKGWQIDQIVQERVAQAMTERSPSWLRVTVGDRIWRHVDQVLQKVTRAVQSPIAGQQDLARVMQDIELGLAGKGFGRTPVRGGSEYKQMHRLLVSEGAKKATEAALELYERQKLSFARWTLNPRHKWQHGKEICERHAHEVNLVAWDYCVAMGLNPTKIDLHGVYPMSKYPDYPHPFCMCMPMPFEEEVKVVRYERQIGLHTGWVS